MDLFMLVTTLFVVIGIATAAHGLWQLVVHRQFLARARRCEGEVVGFVPRTSALGHSRRARVTHVPVVRFTADDGVERTVEVVAGDARMGERVTLAYSTGDPAEVRVAQPVLPAALGSVFGGAVFAAVALMMRISAPAVGPF